jgi:glycosyltransferase involved in cell wall biosynthesis
MNILYIHQYFATPTGTTGTRSYEFSKRWVKAGNKVIMLTTIANLREQDLKDSKGCFVKRNIIDGIDIRAINLPYNQKMNYVQRILSFVGFVFLASIYLLFIEKPDVVYATSTPLTVGIPAMVAKLFKRAPYVFEVRDQWPEVPIEIGIIKNKLLIRILLWLEKAIYKHSSAIVAASPGMADGIKKVLLNEKFIKVIPNSCDLDMFRPDLSGYSIRERYHWNNKLVFLHAGTMGKMNDLGFVINAAKELADFPSILFVLLGDGKQKPALEKKIVQYGLKNVLILPAFPKKDLPAFFAAADIGLVIFGNYPVIEHNSANKFFDALSAGKPILLNYSGWQRKVLEENKAGLGCNLYDIEEFVEKVKYFNSHREQLLEMGKNARQIAERLFDRDQLAAEALKVIETSIKSIKGKDRQTQQ